MYSSVAVNMASSILGRQIFRTRTRNLLVSPYRNGYIVLLPEVPDDLPEKNLKSDGLPEISTLTTDKCLGAIGKFAAEYESAVWKIEDKLKATEGPPQDLFADVLDPLESAGSPLETTWGLMKTLYLADSKLMPRQCYLTIHDKARRARSTKFNSSLIYKACKGTSKEGMDDEKKRVVDKCLLEGRLNGLDLDEADKHHLDNVINKIGKERAKFQNKVEAATQKFQHHIIDPNIVRDFPEHLLKALAVDNTQAVRGPWKVTLEPHLASEFLEYCPIPSLRWNVWQAGVNRASGYASQKDLETSTHLEEIRSLRRDQSKILGYSSFADMSMETKMAGSVKNVKKMMANLLDRGGINTIGQESSPPSASLLLKVLPDFTRASQEAEIACLQEFATSRGFDGSLELWDVPYWRRKQQRTLFALDEERLREFFPLSGVLEGLFRLCTDLFDIIVEEQPGINTWHEDVQYYRVSDALTGETLAGFYLDPYARDNKLRTSRDLGWTVAMCNKSSIAKTQPIASLIFNFPPPLYGKPSLLSFKDVLVIFQKFGHGLQHMLSKAVHSDVSGVSNVEWDAVGVCSHFMTHWLYDEVTMENIGAHYETGEPIPSEMLTCLNKVRHHMTGYDLCQEIYLAMLDLELHTSKEFWLDVVKRVRPVYMDFPLDKHDSHPCSFTAIFSEEWGAAYFCHLWSRIVAADAYSAFFEGSKEEQIGVGNRFRTTFLELGGSCHPSQVFRRFRGRDPSASALLNTLGLKLLNK